jgi:hypothetical protein
MKRSKIISIAGLAGVLAVSGYGQQVVAQSTLTIGGNRANFGVRRVRHGFPRDPMEVSVVSGGSIDARSLNLGEGCVGYVTAQPDLIIRFTGTAPLLRLYVTSSSDTTLLVNTASGGWRCNDDSYNGTNPTVDISDAGPGQYDVWIGSYQSGVQARGVLHITELSNNHP